MASNKKRSPLKTSFMKGLAIILPAFITIAVFAWAWDVLSTYVVTMIVRGLDAPKVFAPRVPLSAEREKYLPGTFDVDGHLLKKPKYNEIPEEYRGMSPVGQNRSVLQLVLDEWHLEREYDPLNGRVVRYHWAEYVLAAIVGIVGIVFLGFATRNYIGRKLYALFEYFANRLPVIRSIYPHAKQLVDFFFKSDEDDKPFEFDTVVCIEYPRIGVWSIAFITGTGFKTVQERTGQRLVTVYVPSSPAPMTGYAMILPADDVITLDISVEEAMKWIITGGVLGPVDETVRPTSGAQFALTRKINEQVCERRAAIERRATQRLDKVIDPLEAEVTLSKKTTGSVPKPPVDPESTTREVDKLN